MRKRIVDSVVSWIDVVAVCAALIGLLGLGAMCGLGCNSGGVRKALLTATEVIEIAQKEVRAECRRLAVGKCKSKPCPELKTCHEAEKDLAVAAPVVTRAAQRINEVIDD